MKPPPRKPKPQPSASYRAQTAPNFQPTEQETAQQYLQRMEQLQPQNPLLRNAVIAAQILGKLWAEGIIEKPFCATCHQPENALGAAVANLVEALTIGQALAQANLKKTQSTVQKTSIHMIERMLPDALTAKVNEAEKSLTEYIENPDNTLQPRVIDYIAEKLDTMRQPPANKRSL